MSQDVIYTIVKDAIEGHDLGCSCYICIAFVNADNGSKGHAAACSAVSDKLYGRLDPIAPKDATEE